MHAESGYWRPKPDGTIEVVIAQSTGLVEVQVPFSFNLSTLFLLTFLSGFSNVTWCSFNGLEAEICIAQSETQALDNVIYLLGIPILYAL